MSSTQTSSGSGNGSTPAAVSLRFEVTVLPVADDDRAKAFYERLGWRLDADVPVGEDFRIVQLTPPGSPASIQFGRGTTTAAPGSAQGLYLVVDDIEAARAELIGRGAEVSEVFHEQSLGGRFNPAARAGGPAPDRATYGSFATFSDPDGNTWLLQEITERLPGRD
jgi:catechol 2,3-dioxygenase-like lactoylglutathione lyase family enzyme